MYMHTHAHARTRTHTQHTKGLTKGFCNRTPRQQAIGRVHCSTLQHNAEHCNTLQHIVALCNSVMHQQAIIMAH